MKKISLFLFLLIGSIVSVFAQEQQILKNGDMEIWKDNSALPAQWGSYYTVIKEGIFSRSANAHSGKYALQIKFEPQKENDNRRFYSYPVSLVPGNYKVTLYMKGKADIRFVSLTQKGENAGGKDTNVNLVGTPVIGSVDNKEWATHSLNFNIKESSDYQIFICVNSADPLLIDDVAIEKI